MQGHQRMGARRAVMLAAPLHAAEPPAVAEPARKVMERPPQLEQRNADLQRQVRTLQQPPSKAAAAAAPASAAPGAWRPPAPRWPATPPAATSSCSRCTTA